MEASQRSSAALLERSTKLTQTLVRRFEDIVALASPSGKDYNTTAHKNLQMEVETAALIRATEDILTLTRQMQELWLFGNLNTLDANDKQSAERMEQDVKAMIASIEGLAKEQL